MKYKWIIGASAFLDVAYDAWCRAHPDTQVEKITLAQKTTYDFDLSALDSLSPCDGTAFVAFDERFGNFKRLELMAAVMERGFKLEPFISPNVIISGDVQVGRNAFIGDGAILGYGSRIGYNSVLLPGVQLGTGVHIRPSCWLEAGVLVGDNAKIGTHCTLRSGVMVAPHIIIGKNCYLDWPRRYEKNIAPKTIFDHRYDSPIYTYEI